MILHHQQMGQAMMRRGTTRRRRMHKEGSCRRQGEPEQYVVPSGNESGCNKPLAGVGDVSIGYGAKAGKLLQERCQSVETPTVVTLTACWTAARVS